MLGDSRTYVTQQQMQQQQQTIPTIQGHYQPIPPPKPNQHQQYEQLNVYQQQQLQMQQAQQLHQQQMQIQQQYQQMPPQNHYTLNPTIKPVSPPMPPTTINSQYSGGTTVFSGAATLRRPTTQVRDSMEGIPNSNIIDNAMFERDKQIYKCTTLRPGGKYDVRNFGGPLVAPSNAGNKPSILNCPLPEIPKDAQSKTNGDTTSPRNVNGNNVGVVHPTMTR